MSGAGMAAMTPEQLANMPLMPNPSGAPPNFVNPNTNAPQAIAAMSVFLGLAIIAVTLRVWSRVSIIKRAGLDDASAVVSLFCSATIVGLITYLLNLKVIGPHTWDVRLVAFIQPKVGGSLLGVQIIGNLANYFAKMTILLFIQRIFPRTVSPKTAYAIWFGIIFNTVAYLIITVYICIQCIPRVGAHGVIPAKCDGTFQSNLGTASAAVNAFTDFYTLVCALPSLWVLHMPMRRKISVVSVLAIGLAACGLSLATLVKRARNNTMDDPARKQVIMLTLGALEPLVAIITACLPAMPALWTELSTNGITSLRRLMSKLGSTTSLRSRSQRSKADDESSLKSLQTHNLTRASDVEQGNKEPYGITSKERISL